MKSPLRILQLEDDPRDAELVQETLEAGGLACEVTRVETETDFVASLKENQFGLILADYSLPSFDGLSALKIARQNWPDVPFIFVAGTLGEEVAIEALKIGATDYVSKTGLSRLVPSVKRALREGEERRELSAERERGEALLSGEKRVLEMIATGAALKEILNCLCLIIEGYRNDTLASVLLLRPDGIHLDSVAGPSLPQEWIRQMESLPIGPCAGSCGTAAYRGSSVIVSDIATDPLWNVPEHRAAALSHGLRASWSNPILSSEGKVLGTFCLYAREKRTPGSHDLGLIEMATHLARVAIERDRAEEALRRSESFLADGQRISHTGSWGWNLSTGEVIWSDEQSRMLGFDLAKIEPTLELFFERVHPEDRVRVKQILDDATSQRREYTMEYRVVLPDESVKHFKSIGRPVVKKSGEINEYIGISMDITESKRAADALRASEQVARGQVEALAQSLDVLATAPDPQKFIGQMLGTIGRLLNAQSVSLWLFDELSDSLILRSSTSDGGQLVAPDPEHPFIKNPLFWKENAVVQEQLLTAGPVVCEDIETDPRINSEWRNYLKQKGTKRFLAVPILVGGHVRGFIGIHHTDQASYRPEEIELTQALAHQVMLAIQLNEFAEQGQRTAVFEERNRMARDIHDTLAQGFTGVIVQLEAAEDAISRGWRKEADEHLQRVGELARRSLSEARRSVHALRPHALQEHNFWDALKGIIKNTTVGTALHTTFETQGKTPELPRFWEENLLHIGQEALTNTLKYAHAQNFRAHLSCNGEGVRLEFRDDGDGFKVKDRHDGVGLTGMRERVEQMGGTLSIKSLRGEGTNIVVVLPYQERILI